MTRLAPLVQVLVAVCFGACDLGAGVPDSAQRLSMSAHLEPGDEVTWCRYVLPALGAPDGLSIQDVRHATGGGATHHVIWYQMAETPASVADKMAPFRCDQGIHLRKIGILYAPPAATGELRWPDGVAAHLDPDAVTLIEWHAINFHPQPVDATLTLELTPPERDAQLRAGTLLFYDWFVHLPPHAAHTSRTRCKVPADVTLMWASQHMHQRGVGFSARLLDAQGAPLRDLLLTDRWDAEPHWFDAGVALRRGQWIEFACSYQNDDDFGVIEGDHANDEMCMFVGGYFPRIDVPLGETCQLGGGSGPVFGGSATCAESLACLARAGDRVQAHACWNDTRAEDSTPLVELAWRCASARCPDVCGDAGLSQDCLTCLDDRCADALATCRDD